MTAKPFLYSFFRKYGKAFIVMPFYSVLICMCLAVVKLCTT